MAKTRFWPASSPESPFTTVVHVYYAAAAWRLDASHSSRWLMSSATHSVMGWCWKKGGWARATE